MADIVRGLGGRKRVALFSKPVNDQQTEFTHGHFVDLPRGKTEAAPDAVEGA